MKYLSVSAYLVLLLAAPMAQATLIIDGTFSATFPADNPNVPIKEYSGSFQLAFEDSVVTGVGQENFLNLEILSFGLTPNPFGATLFNVGNVGASLWFMNGILFELFVGGLPDTSGMNAGEDDFIVGYNSAGEAYLAYYGLSSPRTTVFHDTVEGRLSFTNAVPAPATLALFSIGLAGLGWSRRKKA